MSPLSPTDHRAAFISQLARRLHEAGAAVHRLEGAVRSVAQALGVSVDVLATPTALSISFADDQGQFATRLIRVVPGDINLGRLCAVDEIAGQVAEGRMQAVAGIEALREIEKQSSPYNAWVQAFACGVTSGAVGVLLGLAWISVALAALLGAALSVLSRRLGEKLSESGSLEAVAGLAAAFITVSLSRLGVPLESATVVMASVIIFVPGLGLTTAVTELSTSHWAAGTARLAGALVTLLKLVFGVVLGQRLAALVMPANDWLHVASWGVPPDWFMWVALPMVGFAFGVVFAARPRDLWLVASIALTSFAVTWYGGHAYGPEIGVFLAAFVVAIVSNLFARTANRPATLLRVPGVILLVPGLLSFRSLGSLYGASPDLTGDTAVAALAALTFLVGGLLLGNAFVPPKRYL